MKILMILSVYVTLALGSPLLGSDRCTWGPAYWCSHISHASECGAVQHCIDTVWVHTKLPQEQKNGELCQMCEGVIKEVKQMILDPTLQGQIKKFLDTSCKLMPDVESQRQCQQIVDTYYNEIITMIKSKLQPQQLCAAIGLCPKPKAFKDAPVNEGQSLKFTPAEKPKKERESFTCTLCKIVFTEARNIISQNATQKEVETFIKKELCARLGSLASECDQVVDQYGDMVFELLASELDPETVCRAISFCTSANNPKVILTDIHRAIMINKQLQATSKAEIKKPTPVKSSVECVMCEFVMKELDSMLGTNRTRQAVIKALDNLCDRLPKTVTGECKLFVQAYTPMIIQYLMKGIESDEVCKLMELCKGTGSFLKEKSEAVPRVNGPSTQCVLCEFVMKTLDGLLTKDSSEKEIVAALDKVCALLPASVTNECQSYVNAYGPAIIQLLVGELEPAKVCTFLGICAPAKKSVPLQKTSEVKNVKGGPQCVLCEFVMKELDSLLLKNSTEQDIVKGLEKVCSYLPKTISQECNAFVDQYGPMVVKLLVNDLAPGVVCKFIGLCSAKEVPVNFGQEQCELCKTVIMYINMLLKEQSTVHTIDEILEKVCNYLPGELQKECTSIIEQYGPIIIQKLDQLVNPQQICSTIGLCKTDGVLGHVQLLGADKCTYGPSYWCKTKETAKECQATEHCTIHFWNE